MTSKNYKPVLILLAGFSVLWAPSEVYGQDSRVTAEEREHAVAWGSHHLFAGLFVVGRDYQRDPEQVVAEDIEWFPGFRWEESFEYEVDWENKSVTVMAPGGISRSSTYYGDQGCVIHQRSTDEIFFTPVKVPSALPDPTGQMWPTGDLEWHGDLPPTADAAAFDSVLDWAMEEGQNTRALVVLHEGQIVGERFAPGFTGHTPQISWSQGKSITAALVGVLVGQGELELDQAAPVPEWHVDPDDPRREIKIRDLLHMSSGLDFQNYGDSDTLLSFTAENEHFLIYFDAINVFEHAINQPMDLPPNAQFRYRNSDPLTLGRIIRQTVEARGENYHTFPQRDLFDKIGMRDVVLETDTYGNFIMTGYDFVSAYDWARFGLLHLWDGEWMGERVLPEGWVEFISTPTDSYDGYGGLFWLNAGGTFPDLPGDTYWPAGHMGQLTIIIPSLDMVVVRLGPSPGGYAPYMYQVLLGVIDALGVTADE
jgi:CubicO group peptidase (beta-lactamase class C family)